MSTQIQIRDNSYINSGDLSLFQIVAKNAHTSGLYKGAGGESAILMILLTAQELAIGPMMALNGGIYVVNGKVELSARCMNYMIKKSGNKVTVKESNKEKCILLGERKDGQTMQCEFSTADAEKAGLLLKDNWKKYPEDMLYNRCMSKLARRLFPDVIGESYIEGEVSESIENKETNSQVIDVHAESVEKPQEQEPAKDIISTEDYDILIHNLSFTTEEYQKNFPINVSKFYEISDYSMLKQDQFKKLMRSIEMNISSIQTSEELINV